MKRALTIVCANTVIFVLVQVILGAMKHYDDTCFLITAIGTSIIVALDIIINQYWQN